MKKRKIKKYRLFLILGTPVVLLAVLIFFIDVNMSPLLLATAQAKIKASMSTIANDCVMDTIDKSVEYTDLVSIVQDQEGKMSYMVVDTVKLNSIAYRVSTQMQSVLSDYGRQEISLRLGAVIGSDLLSNFGPYVKVSFEPIGNVSGEYASEFESAGINQTRHKIYLIVSSEIEIILPTGSTVVLLETKVVISESIIIGSVPDSYVNVNDPPDEVLNLLPE